MRNWLWQRGRWLRRAHSIGYLHAQAYVDHPDCELIAGVDINPENGQAFQEHFSVAGGTDLAEVLASHKPDIVSICTYAGSHRSILETLLEHNVRGIWCEKPFALTIDDATAMMECAKDRSPAGGELFAKLFAGISQGAGAHGC